MKRLITLLNGSGRRSVMTLLLLFGVLSGMWADNLEYGEQQNGTDQSGITTPITYSGGVGTATMLNLSANTTYWFGFKDQYDNWYGKSNYTISSSCSNLEFIKDAKACHFTTTTAGDYKFTVSWTNSTPYVTITYPSTSTVTVPTDLEFRSDYTGWDKNNDMTSSDGGKTWTYTLDLSSNLTKTVWFRFIDTANENHSILASGGNGTVVPVDNTTGISATMKSNDDNNFKFAGNGKYTKYLITVKYEDANGWVVYVKGTEKVADYYITSNGVKNKGNLKDGKFYFTLPASCYKDGKISFNISKVQDNTTTYLSSSSSTAFSAHTGDNTDTGSNVSGITDTSTGSTDFTYSSPAGATADDPDEDIEVIYDATNKTLTLKYESRQDIMGYSYYLIVPNENVGNTGRAIPDWEGIAPAGHKAFRIQAGRQRESENLIKDLTTISLKIDNQQLRYDKNGEIKFYIQSGESNLFLQPDAGGNDCYIKQTVNSTNEVDGYDTRTKEMSSTKTNEYYIIKKSAAADEENGETKSLTFMFSKDNASQPKSGSNPGNSINGFVNNGNLIVGFLKTRGVGSTYYNSHISGKQIYLVGSLSGDKYLNGSNTTDATNTDTYYDKSKYEMKPNYWYGGAIDNTRGDIEKADSIVYSCEIRKDGANWNNFFLSFSTSDKLGHSTDGDDNNMWNPILRPHVQDQMDGQALEGGVFFYKDDNGTDNQQQSLNPLLTDAQKARYASYRVYFNATYSTYRVEFFDKFCIGGPAVNGISDDKSNGGTYFDKNHRYGLTAETINGVKHYKYTGEFTNGSTFAFFENPESYTDNYSEDDDYNFVNSNSYDVWHTQAPTGDDAGKDYPFYNTVKYNENSVEGTTTLGDGNNAILWTLPTGTYTLRFYEINNGGTQKFVYTIDKEVTLKNVTSNFAEAEDVAEKAHNYHGWLTFSDDCALWLPTGIKAYYVSGIEGYKAVLKEVTDNTVPAHCGVLLYDPNLDSGSESIHLYPVPTGYTAQLEGENFLVDCSLEDTYISHIQDDKFNYFLNYQYYTNKEAGTKINVPLNFWKTLSNSKAKKNYTYLSVSTKVLPVAFNSDTHNYEMPASAAEVALGARSYCFPLSFEGFDDPIITGITSIDSDKNVNYSDVWYSIQGVKISMPNVPGIYIHNGKKIIIK